MTTTVFKRVFKVDHTQFRQCALNALAGVVAYASACAVNPKSLRPVPANQVAPLALCTAPASCKDTITFQFLGGAGVLMQENHRAPAILTAPLFSNPRLSRTLLPWFPMRPNAARIASGLDRSNVDSVAAILVGHGHYDHLFDVAPIATHRAKLATIYGSSTVFNILQGDSSVASRARNITDDAGSASRVGRWTYVQDRRWRIMPLVSSHAANFLGLTFVGGTRDTPRESMPRTAYGYKKGATYAWLIDYMGDDSVPKFRIFYQDAAAKPEFNALPPFVGNDIRVVDLAIMCVGNWNHARGYPDTLLAKLTPRHVALAHWDDFFRDPRKPVRVVALGEPAELAKRLDRKAGPEHWSTISPKGKLQVAF